MGFHHLLRAAWLLFLENDAAKCHRYPGKWLPSLEDQAGTSGRPGFIVWMQCMLGAERPGEGLRCRIRYEDPGRRLEHRYAVIHKCSPARRAGTWTLPCNIRAKASVPIQYSDSDTFAEDTCQDRRVLKHGKSL